ncbi:class I SAM-dependent methyltransferase [Sulfitobacter donghicola]|uniref:Ubiquinone/menaquinone biosynthesis methyltransferase n=1 Tax=Sulfitobacter donghicola DSW-25 = KCTC 12864 = JCM 14565 TaxID=1300350 RepID=A0A073IJ19_9RHOB|nr:class I SAM-dependent methyltransferase [Sulfitobacter donghicola]KEJ89540.1 ubiquinone/menaquinone biosynthesis methyltransferase [Sulfitobacter donghicola DSW-25 = KCTC 12864 = JCM 14565]KIN69365.1 Methyltransferase type 12 [Sulfitobacter donghicola DSW-25 = KCTC 12864 = JCM 14565]
MTTDLAKEAFFTLHRDLPREGPGEAGDVVWAASFLDLPARAQIADVACGPGADIEALLAEAEHPHVTALDLTEHFVAAARQQWRGDDRVTVLKADMKAISNPYDLIWCAGAVYFMGIGPALKAWRKSLLPDGAIAFSEVCWFSDDRSPRAEGFWAQQYPNTTDEAGITAQIKDAGYKVIGQRRLSDAAWEAYFGPLDARIAQLRDGADAALNAVLDEAEEEAACWRAHRDEYGYLLSVVRPV